jgi:UDP-glucose:(heptosyl)LPS alpha-1,3-glucosyltransferase
MKKKLCIITTYFNYHGGIEKVIQNQLEYLLKKYEVHIITSKVEDNKHKNIKFHIVKLKSRFWIFNWVCFYFKSYFLFKKIDKKYKFDIVHKHATSFIKSDFFTAHSVHKKALKINMKEQKNTINKIKYFISTLYPIAIILEKYNLKRTKFIIALSKGIRNELIKEYNINKNKIFIIPNGINNKFEKFNKNKLKIKGIDNKDIKFIFVGKDYIRKGLFEVIDIFDILINKQKINNIKLIILGKDKNNFKKVKKLIDEKKLSNYIFLLGHKKNVNDYYNISDIFIFPSKYEAFPIVILEASLNKLCILTNKINGCEDLIKNNINGFLLKSKKEYINVILKLIENKKKIKKIGENAYKEVITNYTWEKITNKIIKYYDKFT